MPFLGCGCVLRQAYPYSCLEAKKNLYLMHSWQMYLRFYLALQTLKTLCVMYMCVSPCIMSHCKAFHSVEVVCAVVQAFYTVVVQRFITEQSSLTDLPGPVCTAWKSQPKGRIALW